jgi:signal transduction histidine kinase
MAMGTAPGPGDAAAIVVAPGGSPPSWSRNLGPVITVPPDSAALAAALADAEAVFIDAGVEAPLAVARRARRLAPAVQLVLVADREQAGHVRRTMLFTPGLGEPWVVAPDEADAGLVRRARDITRQRRSHARVLDRVSGRVSALQRPGAQPRRLSDQYLVTLLEMLPAPVLALDEDGAILFANPQGQTAFALDMSHPAPGDLETRLAPSEPEVLASMLAESARGVVRRQLPLRGGGQGERIYDAVMAPVRSEKTVRALVLHDVTEQVRAQEAVTELARERAALLAERDRALEGLRSAMRQRSRFYASMSHELRTPINAIIGYNDLLADQVYGPVPEQQQVALERIRRAARHLLDLVNDILDLSKVEAGKISVAVEDVWIDELVRDLEATMQPLARSHGVELRFHCDPGTGASLRTDPRRVRQVAMNLLSNAIRYGAGAPVDVRCVRGDGLRISIEDRGPGIPAERLGEIFDEFVQLGNGEQGGTGLGLAIARSLARSLGGEVTVESEIGAGSTFTVVLPETPPAGDG